ncbi:succinate dehydrogenase membrane anchor subunit [Candidatus Steffania adelgidicola]|uniref:succinate dehydrogenase membrane anchor subunit n=1 Tax=Candidatus Steffania adelgidicola TaxID=1076626 RepID=UPI001D00B913|nr:succinate dehydrogenase membrane anchor subunit [Candidatus Steffania adelgidicola]UDG79996.1 Succinate dehydrogenase hydrophobic membrane anchor subunit [Candidatus Steffania adelgidicola]
MVSNTSALGRNGVHEWLLVRSSAILIFLYIMYLAGFILFSESLTYELWRSFFSNSIMKVFTMLTLLSILVHTWIGMWQILTDYIKTLSLRLLLQLAIATVLIAYLLYGTVIVWGV